MIVKLMASVKEKSSLLPGRGDCSSFRLSGYRGRDNESSSKADSGAIVGALIGQVESQWYGPLQV